MTGKTHIAVSAAAVSVILVIGQTLSHVSNPTSNALAADSTSSSLVTQDDQRAPALTLYTAVLLLAVGVLAGLFPDLDAPGSELQILPQRIARRTGRYIRAAGNRRSLLAGAAQALIYLASHLVASLMRGASTILRSFTHHRGFTHTLRGALTFTALAALLAFLLTGNAQYSACVGAVWLVGYASHLLADACTPSGIPLFGVSKGRKDRAGAESKRASRLDPVLEPNIRAVRTAHTALTARNLKPHTRHQSVSVSALRSSRSSRSSGAMFHLLPRKMLVTTGTVTDTVIVRWASWFIFLGSVIGFLTGLG